jgi:hypothetical protein
MNTDIKKVLERVAVGRKKSPWKSGRDAQEPITFLTTNAQPCGKAWQLRAVVNLCRTTRWKNSINVTGKHESPVHATGAG